MNLGTPLFYLTFFFCLTFVVVLMLQKSTPIELKHVFNKNDYATTSEWIRFNFQKKLNQQKHIQPTKKGSAFQKHSTFEKTFTL